MRHSFIAVLIVLIATLFFSCSGDVNNNSNNPSTPSDITSISSIATTKAKNLSLVGLGIKSGAKGAKAGETTKSVLCEVSDGKAIPILFNTSNGELVSISVRACQSDADGEFLFCYIEASFLMPDDVNVDNIGEKSSGLEIECQRYVSMSKPVLINLRTGKVVELNFNNGSNWFRSICSDESYIFINCYEALYKIPKNNLNTAIPLNIPDINPCTGIMLYSDDRIITGDGTYGPGHMWNAFDKAGIKAGLKADSGVIVNGYFASFFDSNGKVVVLRRGVNWADMKRLEPNENDTIISTNVGGLSNLSEYLSTEGVIQYLGSGENDITDSDLAKPADFSWEKPDFNIFYLSTGYLKILKDGIDGIGYSYVNVDYPSDYATATTIGFAGGYRYYLDSTNHLKKVDVKNGSFETSSYTIKETDGFDLSSLILAGNKMVVNKYLSATSIETYTLDISDLTVSPVKLSSTKAEVVVLNDLVL